MNVNLDWNLSAAQVMTPDGPVSLQWLPVIGASGYQVYRHAPADGPGELLATVTEPAYTDEDAQAGLPVRYEIVPTREALPDAPLPAPAALSATATGPASAALSWPMIPGAQGYVVYRGTDPAQPLERIGAAAQNTYADSGLLSGATYYYRVAAYHAAGTGALSPVAAVTTLAVPAPGHVSAQAVSPCDILLRWGAVEGAGQYVVSRGRGAGPLSPIAAVPGTAYRDTALEPGTLYRYQVAAAAAGGTGAPSVTVSAETWSVVPPPSSELRARALSCRSIAVSWTPVPGASQYILSRSVLPDGPYQQVAATAETIYPDTGLMPNTTYYYRLTAISSGVTGVESAPVSAATLPTCEAAPSFAPSCPWPRY